ncbi:alanine/glycine:cation symporter family protein [Brevibacterium sp. UMB1308A]|uniref:alanine/glycine:cation symporter family protein n=1 Tax=Brevibacterium sp. UMB1308A TaxID=3050608 RepID=UPI003307B71B
MDALSNANQIEEAINTGFEPIATGLENIVFFAVPVAGGSLPLVLVWLIVGATIFTIITGFIQFRGFGVALEVVRGKFSSKDDPGEVTHFQALASAVSGTVGLGNIAGVGVAMSVGGPGAAFWMMVAGILGMATKFVECTLGVKYREIDENGVVHGGPFKYLPIAFKRFGGPVAKVLTGIFAIAILLFGVVGGGMFQSNQAFVQMREATGGAEGPLGGPLGGLFTGILLAGLVGLVVIGGIKVIGSVTDKLVPAMAVLYIGSCLIVIFGNFGHVPAAFAEIFAGAFTPEGGLGGMIGVMIVGFQRAAFSNEAGIGSSPIAHSAVKTRRPVSEGFVALLEPFIDTVVVCLMTALTVIIAGGETFAKAREDAAAGESVAGVELVSSAFSSITGWWPILLAIAVVLFAISTLITWAYYGEKAWHYLFGRRNWSDTLFRLILMAFILIGCLASFGSIVAFADAVLFICCFINIFGLYLLVPEVLREMKQYLADRKAGTLYELGAESEAELQEIREEQGNA